MFTTSARYRAAIALIAPLVLLAGVVYHPYVTIGTDEAALAEAAAADTTRWGLAHLAIGIGYVLLAIAFIAIRSYLREAGEERWSAVALPLIVAACGLFPILTGMEFALLAAAETGGAVEAAQSEVMPWFLPILVIGAISFTLGALGFARGIARSGVLGSQQTRLVVGALLVMAAARFVPLGAAQIVIGAAASVALAPLAYVMWERPRAQPQGQPRPTPAS
jgi:hypothetical protein